jgi:hypothetical protein
MNCGKREDSRSLFSVPYSLPLYSLLSALTDFLVTGDTGK